MAKVVVLGGGYAGLACLIELSKREKGFELHLVDRHPVHYKITNLHKTFAQPVDKFSVPYAELAEKFNFSFHQHQLSVSEEDLCAWQARRSLPLQATELPFDYLVISTGAKPLSMPEGQEALEQNDLRSGDGTVKIEDLVAGQADAEVQVSLVGGGATGIQMLFELQDRLRKSAVKHRLRLIDLGPQLLPEFPAGFHRYIGRKLRRGKIDYLPATKYLGHENSQIRLLETATDKEYTLPSDLAVLLPGVAPHPRALQTNGFGQVIREGKELSNIFSAGDCSSYQSSGLNRLTAQAAVRKGKLVARNIHNLWRGRSMQTYRYQEKGYLISLGATDAIGWLGLRCNLVKGFPALMLKEAMETQYDLFLDGIDTYLELP